MIKILIILLVVIWAYNYYKFRRKIKYFMVMIEFLQQEINEFGINDPYGARRLLSLSSALIEVQHYKDAYDIYLQAEQIPSLTMEYDKIQTNKQFCIHPCAGCKGPKNLNHSYWHNFKLVRLGGRRYNFLTEGDVLQVNSIIRNKHK